LITLLLAKITGVQISSSRLSKSVLMINSGPIPFRSPQLNPITDLFSGCTVLT